MEKIAFCFLIYDNIEFEEFWYDFFKGVDPDKYSIYIHYKENKPLKYFEGFKLDNCIDTEYGHESLVKAQNILLRKALEDEDNRKFVFVSNSCIPLKRFDYVYDFLLKDDLAYFNYFRDYVNDINRLGGDENYNALISNGQIKLEHFKKAHQWCILNRNIANAVCDDILLDIINRENGFFAPDELVYVTAVHQLGLTDEVRFLYLNNSEATTFVNWSNHDYKYRVNWGGRPFRYALISEEELTLLLKSPCLFGRKFENLEHTDKLQKILFLQSSDKFKNNAAITEKLQRELFSLVYDYDEVSRHAVWNVKSVAEEKFGAHDEILYTVDQIYSKLMNEIWGKN